MLKLGGDRSRNTLQKTSTRETDNPLEDRVVAGSL